MSYLIRVFFLIKSLKRWYKSCNLRYINYTKYERTIAMEKYEENIDFTSGEIGYLWQTYQYESITVCGLTYFLQHIDDQAVKKVLEKALDISQKRLSKIKEILTDANYQIPQGFTEGDVNLQAPRLFSDKMYLQYLIHMLQMELKFYGTAMLGVVKLRVQNFYQQVIKDTMELEMEAKELAKRKGLYIRAPKVPSPKHIEFVKKESFLAGWFGETRPLLAIEIAELVFNAKRNALGHAVITAFAQVTKLKDVRDYFIRGKKIANKHVETFTNKLHKEDLADATSLLTAEITESTESPFSDKLMMNFIANLIGSSLVQYGSAMAMSPRRDLGVMYTKLMAEIAKYSNDGEELLIANGWMEKPPIAVDREKLMKKESE